MAVFRFPFGFPLRHQAFPVWKSDDRNTHPISIFIATMKMETPIRFPFSFPQWKWNYPYDFHFHCQNGNGNRRNISIVTMKMKVGINNHFHSENENQIGIPGGRLQMEI